MTSCPRMHGLAIPRVRNFKMQRHNIRIPIRRSAVLTLVLGTISSVVTLGQSIVLPTFEVASVRPSDPKAGPAHIQGGPGTSDPGHATYTNLPLSSLLIRAYGISSDQIIGPPSLRSGKYDIVAKVPPGTTKEQFNLMLINLIVERFNMVVHHEMKEFQGYELIVARNGPKLKKSSAADSDIADRTPLGPSKLKTGANGYPELDGPGMTMPPILNARVRSTHMMARAQTLSTLARVLGDYLSSHIVDSTGLAGRYDFTLDYSLDPQGSSGEPIPSRTPGLPDIPDNSAPYILDALQAQLGLKLQPAKIPSGHRYCR